VPVGKWRSERELRRHLARLEEAVHIRTASLENANEQLREQWRLRLVRHSTVLVDRAESDVVWHCGIPAPTGVPELPGHQARTPKDSFSGPRVYVFDTESLWNG
jgi:hypothetical protein